MTGRRGPRDPVAGRYEVDAGTAELVEDPERPHGWLLTLDGTPQSYVDLADPQHLEFDYVRLLADVVDLALPAGRVDAVHVGGGGCTLPRYVAATRPRSRQVVVEPDAALVDLVRTELRLADVPGLRVRVAPGRSAVAGLPDASADVLVTDAFAGALVPVDLTTVEYARDVARVLRPGAVALVNLADARPLAFARSLVATWRAVLPEAAVLADPGVLRGRRFGNLVLAASGRRLPVEELARRCAGRAAAPARVLTGEDLDRFVSGARPRSDDDAGPSPVPPPGVFGRPR